MTRRIEKLERDITERLERDISRIERLERVLTERLERDIARMEVGYLRTSYSAHTLETNQFGLLQAGGGPV
jgi:hypothetical protein